MSPLLAQGLEFPYPHTHAPSLEGDSLLTTHHDKNMTTVWTPNTAYALNAMVRPPTPNGYRYKCTTPGTSADVNRRYESYTVLAGAGGSGGIYSDGTFKVAQTFTPSVAHTTGKIVLYIIRSGSPGNVTLNIEATTDGKPNSTVLTTETFNGNALQSGGTPPGTTILLSSPLAVNAGTMYAITLHAPSGNSSNYVSWWLHTSSPYTGGTRCSYFPDLWEKNSGSDSLFEEWSYGTDPVWPTTPGATVTDGTVVWTNDGKRTNLHRSFVIG